MKTAIIVIVSLSIAALPTQAFEFLGVELCEGSIDTGVELPPASQLNLESVEIGDNGGLVMLLSAKSGKVMDRVDDLMTGLTGARGVADDDTLEWTGGRLTGVAQRVAKKYAALAVASTDVCAGATPAPTAEPPEPAAEAPAVEPPSTGEPVASGEPATAAAQATAAAATVVTVSSAPAPEPEPVPTAAEPVDFEVVGAISHEAADRTWVDVMGVVANHTDTGYRLATFDLSMFRADGSLICVDTISVSVLKVGQERAFRDAIRCPGYEHGAVDELRLQFAGGF